MVVRGVRWCGVDDDRRVRVSIRETGLLVTIRNIAGAVTEAPQPVPVIPVCVEGDPTNVVCVAPKFGAYYVNDEDDGPLLGAVFLVLAVCVLLKARTPRPSALRGG